MRKPPEFIYTVYTSIWVMAKPISCSKTQWISHLTTWSLYVILAFRHTTIIPNSKITSNINYLKSYLCLTINILPCISQPLRRRWSFTVHLPKSRSRRSSIKIWLIRSRRWNRRGRIYVHWRRLHWMQRYIRRLLHLLSMSYPCKYPNIRNRRQYLQPNSNKGTYNSPFL